MQYHDILTVQASWHFYQNSNQLAFFWKDAHSPPLFPKQAISFIQHDQLNMMLAWKFWSFHPKPLSAIKRNQLDSHGPQFALKSLINQAVANVGYYHTWDVQLKVQSAAKIHIFLWTLGMIHCQCKSFNFNLFHVYIIQSVSKETHI